ncbi:MAG: PHP domain-containing protein [Chloroflexi bacterium]|nr:PHP domain-containing protein [Chloroflexota bacterium]
MHTYKAELHVHTVLSPCAGVEMIPPLIVDEALSRGIHLLAITDHNGSANAAAVMQAALDTGLSVLPGMELQTREEVHLLCLFDTLEQLDAWQARVDSLLPDIPNNIGYFGEQFVVDAEGNFIRREERLLLNSVDIDLEHAAEQVAALGGLAIPAHVDRKANGLIEILGLVPPGFEALEISRYTNPQTAQQKYPQLRGQTLLQSGDVHLLDGFLGTTEFTLAAPNISEIRMALKNLDGRQLHIR